MVTLLFIAKQEAESADVPEQCGLTEPACARLISSALDRGNCNLALSIYDVMAAGGASGLAGAPIVDSTSSGSTSSGSGGADSGPVDSGGGLWAWPPASLDTVCALVLGLCRNLRVSDAIR